MTDARAFRGFRFPAEVILWAVRWYLQFPISYRDLERMLADRGVVVDHTTMYRWVQHFAPELEERMRRHLRPCRGPWYVDETYTGSTGDGATCTGLSTLSTWCQRQRKSRPLRRSKSRPPPRLLIDTQG